jgi:hypothetical protein
MQPPEHFDRAVYLEVRDIIRANVHQIAPEAEFTLAQAAGGPMLRAAVSLFEFPPCPAEGKCAECWVSEWCIHCNTPLAVRMALINALGTFTTPGLKIDKNIAERIKTYDKTNLIEIGIILEIAKQCHTKYEKTKNDQAKNS